MKWIKGRAVFILAACIAVWFSIDKLQEAADFRDKSAAVGVRLKGKGITKSKLSMALKEKSGNEVYPQEVTAWLRIGEARIENKFLKRSKKVPVVLTAGNMYRTVPMVLVSGNFVYPADKKGCVIDTKTAYDLFGTELAVNNIVTYEKKDYIIRGIVKTGLPVFLIQGQSNRIEYNNLELTYKEEERGETLTEEFLFINGVTDYVIIDGYFFGQLAESILKLPVWMLYIFASYRILKIYFRKKRKLSLKAFVLYASLIVMLLFGYGMVLYHFTGNPVYIPEKLIPTKWSDFDYWTGQYQNIKSQIQQIRYLNPNPKDIYLTEEVGRLPLTFFLMTILYLFLFYLVFSERHGQDSQK